MRPQDKEIPASWKWTMRKTCSMNPLKQKMTMKKNSILWAALSMTAALVMTACSSDDNDMTEAPVAPSTSKTIPYTVIVGGDEATTRATVDGNNKTLRFATGDKLYITGENIQGVLDLKDGDENKTTGATFSGDLTYSGSGSPASDLSLTATLVSEQQTDGSEVTINAETGAVTVNYPSTAYCTSVNDAVQKYSNLTGTSTYSAKSFSLTQQTAFLNFAITFEDGTTTGTELSAVVSNNSAAVCTANVTTTTESEKVVAKFVLPVAKGTTLSSANVKFGDKAAISFGASQTLEGKVYNVTKTQYTMAANATAGDVGKVICSNGHIHSNVSDVICGGSASAMIAYVGNQNNADGDGAYSSTCNHGLAIALADVINTSGDPQTAASHNNKLTWENAKTACNSFKGSKPSGVTWMLPSAYQWERMLIGCGGTTTYTTSLWDGEPFSYGNFRTQLTNCGTNVQGVYDVRDYYWSSTEYSGGTTIYAWYYRFVISDFRWNYKTSSFYVRAAFAF